MNHKLNEQKKTKLTKTNNPNHASFSIHRPFLVLINYIVKMCMNLTTMSSSSHSVSAIWVFTNTSMLE